MHTVRLIDIYSVMQSDWNRIWTALPWHIGIKTVFYTKTMWGKSSWIFILKIFCIIQGDRLNMTVIFWYFVKSVRYCKREHWTSQFFEDTRNTAMFNWSPCMCIVYIVMNKGITPSMGIYKPKVKFNKEQVQKFVL